MSYTAWKRLFSDSRLTCWKDLSLPLLPLQLPRRRSLRLRRGFPRRWGPWCFRNVLVEDSLDFAALLLVNNGSV
jgi:hypothetical protein